MVASEPKMRFSLDRIVTLVMLWLLIMILLSCVLLGFFGLSTPLCNLVCMKVDQLLDFFILISSCRCVVWCALCFGI